MIYSGAIMGADIRAKSAADPTDRNSGEPPSLGGYGFFPNILVQPGELMLGGRRKPVDRA